jgi:hypothetical protein
VQRRQRDVDTRGYDRHPSETADVAQLEHGSVVERPRGADVGIGRGLRVGDPETAGHAEVHDELAVAVEPRDQVFAPPSDPLDAVCDRVDRRRELRRRVGLRADHGAAFDPRRELAANRLHFG